MTRVILTQMKTAVSLPDQLFRRAEELAQQMGIPRSQLYARAITEYLDSHSLDRVTAALNEFYSEIDSSLDPAVTLSQFRAVEDEEW